MIDVRCTECPTGWDSTVYPTWNECPKCGQPARRVAVRLDGQSTSIKRALDNVLANAEALGNLAPPDAYATESGYCEHPIARIDEVHLAPRRPAEVAGDPLGIGIAQGSILTKLGIMFGIHRGLGESDEQLRDRLQFAIKHGQPRELTGIEVHVLAHLISAAVAQAAGIPADLLQPGEPAGLGLDHPLWADPPDPPRCRCGVSECKGDPEGTGVSPLDRARVDAHARGESCSDAACRMCRDYDRMVAHSAMSSAFDEGRDSGKSDAARRQSRDERRRADEARPIRPDLAEALERQALTSKPTKR